jgi:hypothetical protein
MLKKSKIPEHIPQNVLSYFDLGLVGVEKDYAIMARISFKKPVTKELTPKQKEFNREISRFKVLRESALAEVK